jgi:hypothetical protein
MTSYKDGALFGSVILLGLTLSFAADACSTDGWLGGAVGSYTADSPPTIARYSEFCALSVTGQGHVQSNFASDTRYRARFYVLDSLTGVGTVEIFEAYSDEGGASPLFKISFNGSQFTFDATDAGGGSTTIASVNGWNLIEFDWTSGGNFVLWVNADATTDAATGTIASGSGTVESVRLGAPNGFSQTGRLNFDAFESHRTTPVGPLLVGDANGNQSVNIFDMISIQNEILNVSNLAAGQPDCNANGSVNIFDMICVQNIILGGG